MKQSRKNYYNRQAKNPRGALIESIRKLIKIGKSFDRDTICNEIRDSKLYKDKQVSDQDIEFIINYFTEKGII